MMCIFFIYCAFVERMTRVLFLPVAFYCIMATPSWLTRFIEYLIDDVSAAEIV
jgi:hypothetical protein